MRVVKVVSSFAFVVLGSCTPRPADTVQILPSPRGNYAATIETFNPRGTVSGSIKLSVRQIDLTYRSTLLKIAHGSNITIGWVSSDTILIVGDEIEYTNARNIAYPSGDADEKVFAVICDGNKMDCSSQAERVTAQGYRRDLFPDSGFRKSLASDLRRGSEKR